MESGLGEAWDGAGVQVREMAVGAVECRHASRSSAWAWEVGYTIVEVAGPANRDSTTGTASDTCDIENYSIFTPDTSVRPSARLSPHPVRPGPSALPRSRPWAGGVAAGPIYPPRAVCWVASFGWALNGRRSSHHFQAEACAVWSVRRRPPARPCRHSRTVSQPVRFAAGESKSTRACSEQSH